MGCSGCAPHDARRAVIKCHAAFVGLETALPPKWAYGMTKTDAGEKFTLLCPVCEPHRVKVPQPQDEIDPKRV